MNLIGLINYYHGISKEHGEDFIIITTQLLSRCDRSQTKTRIVLLNFEQVSFSLAVIADSVNYVVIIV